MRILIVCSGTKGILSPFIKEQMEALSQIDGNELMLFQIKRRGWAGYLSHLSELKKVIRKFRPALIHAHYGLSGLLANLQRKVPVVTTFHGSDINNPGILIWSKWTHRLSFASVFVEASMMNKFKKHRNSIIIPCGVDVSLFNVINKAEARKILGLEKKEIYVLFSSYFANPVKNYPLARLACDLVENITCQKVNLVELKGLNREKVNLFLNASDCALLFSNSEGSPQFIKEAMSCNCPIVATDVGDISRITANITGCYISSPDVAEVADKIIMSLKSGRTDGRKRILALQLDNYSISQKLMEVYNGVV
jgi:teichuronic acid biosynthesis glycosyltransferase TuaC